MARLTRESWLDLGLEALASAGPEALTLDTLCARAGRTRGSFYHHFTGIDVFIANLARHWHQRDTEAIIKRSETRGSDRLEALNTLTSGLNHQLEQGMRRLAALHPQVQETLRATDKRRIGYIVKLHMEDNHFAPEEAELLAQVTYAAFIGFQQITPEMSEETAQAAYRRFMALVLKGRS